MEFYICENYKTCSLINRDNCLYKYGPLNSTAFSLTTWLQCRNNIKYKIIYITPFQYQMYLASKKDKPCI